MPPKNQALVWQGHNFSNKSSNSNVPSCVRKRVVQGRHPFTPELLLILGYARLPLECCPLSSRPRRLPVWHCQALPHLPPRSLVLTFTSFLKSRVFPHAPLAHSLTACFPELAALCLCMGWGRRRGISRGPSLGRRRGISREPSLVNGQCIWETLCVVMTLFPPWAHVPKTSALEVSGIYPLGPY